jgi:FixJ family two-component response regulator
VPPAPLVAIVDDDVSIRRATQNLLQAAGFSATTFPNAERFLKSKRRHGISCLVADVRMPGMTGLELYEALAASGDAIPTILITAHDDEAIRLRAREAGVRCYLSKPFSPEELCECIRAALASVATPKS